MNVITAVLVTVIVLAVAGGAVRYTVLRRTAERVPRWVRVAAGLAALLLLMLVVVQTLRPISLVRDPGITILQPTDGVRPTTHQYSAYDGPLLFTVLLVRSPGDSLTGSGYRGAQDGRQPNIFLPPMQEPLVNQLNNFADWGVQFKRLH